MNTDKLFKISEVAKLTNVTRQTLIFYDKKDIIKPDFVDENKYRYYSINQIHLIQIINMLKEFNMPLKTIKYYLDNRDKEQLLQLLSDIQEEVRMTIEKNNCYLKIIENKKDKIKKSMDLMDVNEIKLEHRKPIKVFRSQRLTEADQVNGHFDEVYKFENELYHRGLLGLELDVIVEKDYINKHYENHVSYFCVDVDFMDTDLETYVIPEGLYVTGYNKGQFQTSKYTYKRLLDFIDEHNLEIDGDSYEKLMSTFLTESQSSEYLLEISIKVKKK